MGTGVSFHSFRVRCSLAATLAVALACLLAAGARASTIAYINDSDGNVYVADSTGADVTQVAGGITSPSLARNGDVYALNAAGNAVDVYAPGSGLVNTISISGSGASQLAVSPSGGSLAWTDGAPLSSATTLNVLTLKSNTTQTIANGLGPHWATLGRLAVSTLNLSTIQSEALTDFFNKFSLPVWNPDAGVSAPFVGLVLEYAPNPSGTLAAAVADIVGPGPPVGPFLIVFPINPLAFAPTGGNPLVTDAACQVDTNFLDGPGIAIAWAPNGSALAYDTNSGIAEATVGKWTAGNCAAVVGTPQLVIPNGYAPSWGPSNDRNFTP